MSPTWLAAGSCLCHPSCPVPGHPSSVGDGRILPGDPPAGAQLAASRDPIGTSRGSCSSAAAWHPSPQLLGSARLPPPQGVLVPPAGANSLPCSFSPGVSAEPAGRPGKQIHRRPPQPETSTKQGGDRSGGPPQPCPPLPWAVPEPWAPPSHRHAPDPPGWAPCAMGIPTIFFPLGTESSSHRPGVSALLLSLTPSSRAVHGSLVGDTVRDGGSPPHHWLCLALAVGQCVGQSLGNRDGSGENARAMCKMCFGRVYKKIAEQLLRPAPGGAGVIPEGKRAQEGDSVPSFWGHPAPSLP